MEHNYIAREKKKCHNPFYGFAFAQQAIHFIAKNKKIAFDWYEVRRCQSAHKVMSLDNVGVLSLYLKGTRAQINSAICLFNTNNIIIKSIILMNSDIVDMERWQSEASQMLSTDAHRRHHSQQMKWYTSQYCKHRRQTIVAFKWFTYHYLFYSRPLEYNEKCRIAWDILM